MLVTCYDDLKNKIHSVTALRAVVILPAPYAAGADKIEGGLIFMAPIDPGLDVVASELPLGLGSQPVSVTAVTRGQRNPRRRAPCAVRRGGTTGNQCRDRLSGFSRRVAHRL